MNSKAHLRTKRRVFIAVLLAAMASVAFSDPAAAHNFGLTKSDNSTVTFSSDEYWDHDWSYWNHFVHFEQYDQYGARTDLTAQEEGRKRYNGDTDVIWWAAGLGTQTNADYRCVKVNFSNGRCNQGHLRFNEAYTNRVPANTGWYLACHEFGHSYGFEHLNDGEAGCMTTTMDPWNPPSSGGSLNNHMIFHTNAQY